jgi:hypothetical protein
VDFRFSKANARYARHNVAGTFLLAVLLMLGILGKSDRPSLEYSLLFIVAVGVGAAFWYARVQRVRESMRRLLGTIVTISNDGLTFKSPTSLSNVPHVTRVLRYVEFEAFRVIHGDGMKRVAIRSKDQRWLTLPPLDEQAAFVAQLRRHLPEEKRLGWFDKRWQRV